MGVAGRGGNNFGPNFGYPLVSTHKVSAGGNFKPALQRLANGDRHTRHSSHMEPHNITCSLLMFSSRLQTALNVSPQLGGV